MAAIAFGVLSVASCAFLIYVFVHFHRELARSLKIEKRSAGESSLAYIGSYETQPALLPVRPAPCADEWQRAKTEAVPRREAPIGGIVGLFGLLAPFIFVLLLNSWSAGHR